MSILIRGMDMPKNCWQCPFHDDVDECILLNQSCMKVWGETKRLDGCPIVPIPPHGRLIDADALKDVQQADADFFKGSKDYGEKCRYDEAINAVANIVNAPTIIDAEE